MGFAMVVILSAIPFFIDGWSFESRVIMGMAWLGAAGFLLAPASVGLLIARAVKRGVLLKATAKRSGNRWTLTANHPLGQIIESLSPSPSLLARLRSTPDLWIVADARKRKALLILDTDL
jgi:hypothetical protein